MRARWILIPALLAASVPCAGAAELGTYAGAGCTGVKHVDAFTHWFGAKPQRMLDFFAYDSWSGMVSEARWATKCWQGTGYRMTFSVPMLPGDHVSTLALGAAGDYDHYFRDIAQDIVAAGFPDAVIRIGWEFNGGWYPWAAKQDPANWVTMWRRIVTAMRSVPGQHFQFDWNPTWGMQQIEPTKVYPGDAFVDVIGVDTYNATWEKSTLEPGPRWQSFVDAPYGLKWQADFAASHGKKLSMPEWGTGTRPDGHGPGDDPYFVAEMAKWLHARDVLYHDYWNYDAPDYRARLDDGQFPKSAQAFLQSFGARAQP
jgi:hypothetical protein